MAVTVVRRAETLDQIITRTQGKLTAAQLKDVRAATLAANPHLTADATLPPGSIVVVPPRRDTPAEPPPSAAVSNDVAKILDAAVSEYRADLSKRVETARSELAEMAKLAKSAAVKRAVTQVPDGEQLLSSIDSATKQAIADIDDAREYLKSDLDALAADLRKLSERLPDT